MSLKYINPQTHNPMPTVRTFIPVLALVFVAAACGGANNDAPADTADGQAHQHVHEEDLAARPAAAETEMKDGVQEIRITVGAMGYSPQSIQLTEGVPARLIFTRTVDSACASQVQIPAFGVEKTDLPLNEAVAIAFTPDEGGEFAFVCGMDMLTGTVVVKV